MPDVFTNPVFWLLVLLALVLLLFGSRRSSAEDQQRLFEDWRVAEQQAAETISRREQRRAGRNVRLYGWTPRHLCTTPEAIAALERACARGVGPTWYAPDGLPMELGEKIDERGKDR